MISKSVSLMRKLRPLLKLYIIIIVVRDLFNYHFVIWGVLLRTAPSQSPSFFWLYELSSDVVDLVKIYIRKKRIRTHGRTLGVTAQLKGTVYIGINYIANYHSSLTFGSEVS